MKRYAGVVVLYNPDENVIANIESYYQEISKLYVVDNSDNINNLIVEKIKQLDNCYYLHLGQNQGLASALNIGCDKAFEEGFDYILTMDQDSKFAKNDVQKLINFIETQKTHYAIVCPNVKSIYYDDVSKQEKIAYTLIDENKNEIKNWVMTSGSMMCLKSYKEAGGFDTKMFIGHIDIDLGIKFSLLNLKVIMIGNSIIYQRFGNSKPRKILFKTVHPSFAAPVRTYYIFRNQKYLEKKYGKKFKKFINVHLYKFIIKILLFEDEKFKKLLMAYKGYLDGKKGKMGIYK